jgi:uncharacterized membrane protein
MLPDKVWNYISCISFILGTVILILTGCFANEKNLQYREVLISQCVLAAVALLGFSARWIIDKMTFWKTPDCFMAIPFISLVSSMLMGFGLMVHRGIAFGQFLEIISTLQSFGIVGFYGIIGIGLFVKFFTNTFLEHYVIFS